MQEFRHRLFTGAEREGNRVQITRTRSTLRIRASAYDFLFGRVIPPAKSVLFDRTWGEVTVRPRLLSTAEGTIPYRHILKVHHRINAPIVRIGMDNGGYTYYRSVSAVSEVSLELRDASVVPLYTSIYDQGGDSRTIREKIRESQRLVDEIANVTEKPMVIDFQEVECTFDMAERKILFSGIMLPRDILGLSLRFDQVERMEMVETPTGYFSFTVFPRWGKGIRTTEGYDTTNYLSDTVTMIAKRSNLFLHKVEKKPLPTESVEVPNAPIRPRMGTRAKPVAPQKAFDLLSVFARFRRGSGTKSVAHTGGNR